MLHSELFKDESNILKELCRIGRKKVEHWPFLIKRCRTLWRIGQKKVSRTLTIFGLRDVKFWHLFNSLQSNNPNGVSVLPICLSVWRNMRVRLKGSSFISQPIFLSPLTSQATQALSPSLVMSSVLAYMWMFHFTSNNRQTLLLTSIFEL